MPVHPRYLPALSSELASSDWNEIQDAFQVQVNLDPATVIPQNAARAEACYSLLFQAYALRKLDAFLADLGQRLAVLRARIAAIVGTSDRCPTEAVTVGMLPLMDRQSLRQQLLNMVQNVRILTIEGGPATGKSYSAHLIEHVGRNLAGADAYTVRLGRLLESKLFADKTSDLEPFELMEIIGDYLGLQLRPDLRTAKAQDSRIIQKLLHWLSANFSQRRHPATPVWLILDDLNFTACPSWVHDFALALAEASMSPQLSELRLFLIGLNHDRLVGDVLLMSTQDIHSPLTQDDVWDFIVRAAAERNKPVDPASKGDALSDVWGNYSAPLKHEEAQDVARKAAILVRGL